MLIPAVSNCHQPHVFVLISAGGISCVAVGPTGQALAPMYQSKRSLQVLGSKSTKLSALKKFNSHSSLLYLFCYPSFHIADHVLQELPDTLQKHNYQSFW